MGYCLIDDVPPWNNGSKTLTFRGAFGLAARRGFRQRG